MKCIDAVEGTIKCILARLSKVSFENRLDDSEYIITIKAVIEAAELHLKDNPEIAEDPGLLIRELYTYARNLWLKNLSPDNEQETVNLSDSDERNEYQTYYFDYLYNRGIYPR